ncbi:hypothetical protein WA026_016054 [Henosepilachna vigintioctopunctata]|uniref:Transmembrane protein 129 n=1 Tax=Henosepilachna vigintioctopunctata TaxID=420089 RepID=A0AAW1U8P9_9CUCU
MDQSDLIFSALYLLLCVCMIYPPAEFVSAGLTIPVLFSKYLGKEEDAFIHYHIKRSCLTLVLYALFPVGYIFFLIFFGNIEMLSVFVASYFGNIYLALSILLPIAGLCQIRTWSQNNYDNHPIAVNLSKFCNNNMNWKSVQLNIEAEFQRSDKIYIQTNPIAHIVVTENWILKVTPFTVLLGHQSDSTVTVKTADTHDISTRAYGDIQFLNIEVKSSREGVPPFIIRINSVEFQNLQIRLNRTINVMPNVKFHKTIIDQFIDVFKNVIKENDKYNTNQAFEQCIGCLEASPGIKLQKLCLGSTHNDDSCAPCYCRPMWCVDCMAKWFVSRQDPDRPSTWLSSKCTCPMCRAKFCILDVCLLSSVDIVE